MENIKEEKYEQSQIVIINTDHLEAPKEENDINLTRTNISDLLHGKNTPIVSVLIIAYNRLDKTKNCVESVLKYTANIDYELVLVDNGSSDGTFEYFKSVQHDNKKVVRITKNLQTTFGLLKGYNYCHGKYIAFLNNDMIVTKDWLSNLLKCMESDERIGLACAMSSNVSNLQQADISFSNFQEMQLKASKYNVSDCKKWHERLRLVSLGIIYKSECINIAGNWDYGFYHDFADDDFSFHIRRSGYKTILCKDVFIHHDHDIGSGKHPGEFEKSIEKGKENFKKKYYGIDPWEDVNNYEVQMIGMVKETSNKKNVQVLGVDVRCGTPILEVKNKLRGFDVFDADLSAYTERAKYFIDLSTICQGQVECDRVEYISEYFNKDYFDYIVVGKALNLYSEPFKLLVDMIVMLKEDGQLLIKFRNTYDLKSLINILSGNSVLDDEYPVQWSLNDLNSWLESLGYIIEEIEAEHYQVDNATQNKLKDIVSFAKLSNNINDSINKIMARNYIISIRKKKV